MSTHIIFRILKDIVVTPYDEEFFKCLLEINQKFPDTLPMVRKYVFLSKKAFSEWMDELVPYLVDLHGDDIFYYNRPVDVDRWKDVYVGDEKYGEDKWKDFDLIVSRSQEYLEMMDKTKPLHPFFHHVEEECNTPSLLHALYAKKSIVDDMEWLNADEA